MSLNEEDRQIIVQLEMEKAEKIFSQSEVLMRAELWDTLANRVSIRQSAFLIKVTATDSLLMVSSR